MPPTIARWWNWKSALLSSLFRAVIFLVANLKAGLDEATGAMLAEFVYRAATAGFYGRLTQAFRRMEPAWRGALCVSLLLPAAGHSLEFLVHWLRGTPNLKTSIAASVAFTLLSSLFHWFAMRRGLFIVGPEARPLADDFRSLPRLLRSLVWAR